MPNYLGGGQPFVATDPRAFSANMRANRQVDNQTRQVNMQEKQLLLEEMAKQDAKQKEKDIQEALEEASSVFGGEWQNIPDTLRYGYTTSVHAMDQKGALEWLKRIDDWKKNEVAREDRAKQGQAMFPTRTQGPVEPVDTERLAMQSAYAQGGMGDVAKYAGAMKDMREAVPKPPEPPKTRTIKEGDIERTEEWIDGKWHPIATAPRYKPTTNVNVDVDMGLSKGARAKAEEDVQESTDMYKGLENLVAISKPEFFTYKGQIQAGAERLGEKAGVVKDPQFLKEYSSWKVGTEQEFNKYRKWATGVAAGEKELERLASSFPNINMSKTQYMAAAKQTAINAWKLAERRRRALNAGINDPGKQKDFYRLLPLDAMPDPPAEVTQRFSPNNAGPTVMEERTLPNGQVWQQLSDGTFKQVK